MKKILSLLLAVAMAIGLTACGGDTGTNDQGKTNSSESTGTPTYKKTITIAPSLDFNSKDVQNDAGQTSKTVYSMVFDTLVEYDTVEGKYIPGLATEWSQINDTLWEFKLREGVTFHDGSPFTSEDVKFTIERGWENSQSKSRLSTIEEVIIVDEYTVQLQLIDADYDLAYKLAEPNTSILCAKTFQEQGEEAGFDNGTGPYMYGEWVQGDYLQLLRFEDFWGGAKKTEEFIFKYIPEAASRLIALQNGEVDYCLDPPSVSLHYVAEDPNLVLYQIPSSNMRYVFLNTSIAPFDDIRVRQAVAHAIDRESMIIMVYEGNAQPATNVMHPTCEFYSELPYLEYDPELSKQLLAEAGYPNGFKTEIYSSTGSVQKAVAATLQGQLSEVGIQAEIFSLESAVFNANSYIHNGPYPIGISGWGGFSSGPDNGLRSIFYSSGSLNAQSFDDPYIDQLIDEAKSTGDEEERMKLYTEISEYMINDSSWIPIAIEQFNIGIRKEVQGFEPPFGLQQHLTNLYIEE